MKIFRALKVVMVAALITGYSQAAFGQNLELNENLVAYYPFNGNANDESGNGNHGTVNGAALAKDRFGATGEAYNFDGESYIKTSSGKGFPTNGDFTVSLWFTFDFPLVAGQGRLFANQMFDQFQLAFDTWTSDNPKIQFYTGGAPVLNATELQWEDKKWYDITLVRRGNSYYLYRDGFANPSLYR